MSELKNIDIQVLDASSSSDFVAVEDRSDLKIQSKMPLFAADFIENQNILLIGGGGGGRTGIRNGVIIGRIEGNGSQKTKDQNLKKMVFLKILNFDQNLARCIFVKSDLIAVSYGKYLVFIKNSEISNLLNEDRSPIEKIECERIGFNIKDPDFVVRHMSLNPDGNKMAVVISDNTISLHLLQIGSKWPKMEFEGTIIAPRQITSIAWSPNGQEIVIAYNWKYFSVFKSSSPHNEIARIPIESWLHRNDQIMAFKEAIFVNQKKLLFAVNLLKGKSPISGGAICFYERSFNDSQNWILKRFCVVNKSGVVLKLGRSDKLIAAADTSSKVFFYSAEKNNYLGKIATKHNLPITDFVFDKNGENLITVSADNEARLHNVKRFKRKSDLGRWNFFNMMFYFGLATALLLSIEIFIPGKTRKMLNDAYFVIVRIGYEICDIFERINDNITSG